MRPIRANKTLGQNFLKSRRALGQIVRAAEIAPASATGERETVLEIGPGKGVLTRVLLEAGARVVAVEKDERLVELLQETFATEIAAGTLVLKAGDILELDLASDAARALFPVGGSYKLVANIPYYITGQIIRTFLSAPAHLQPTRMVLLLQKEVVDRIIARDGKESLLSLAVKAYGQPKKMGVVKREDFSPAPNVDSAILLVADISKEFFATETGAGISEHIFFDTLHAGFAHKRKKLLRNLETIASLDTLTKIFAEENISENTRAEDISLAQWRKIAAGISAAHEALVARSTTTSSMFRRYW